MEWIQDIFNPGTLALLIPLVAIIGAFAVAALKAHHKHQERIEKIKQGFDIYD
ncbi:hypothetical protein [Thalassotalea eurytherma]|uniref:DUF3149 domain-containing protein n=1 Tax=Thalassotalea eurytherma TaxID=1144278 RepID=A0ABQ6H8U6_9GAMM|nr:hypothetical protein [Thalassotalea eurytherma]GLX83296.1 hypothetical protein theurythT_27480 [Thalassotalea eurytherma]